MVYVCIDKTELNQPLFSGSFVLLSTVPNCLAQIRVKSVQLALSDLKRPPERLQSQCNYRLFIT